MSKIEIGFRNQNKKGEWFTVKEYLRCSKYSVVFDTGEIREPVDKGNVLSGSIKRIKALSSEEAEVELGERFGKLVVVSLENPIKPECLCDCGNTCSTIRNNLIRGRKTSCGCLATKETYDKFWIGFNKIIKDWDASTEDLNIKKLPTVEFKRGSTDTQRIKGYSLVDADFYNYWKEYPFTMDKLGYVSLCGSKQVYENLRKGETSSNDRKPYKLHHLVYGCTNFSNYVIDHIDGNPLNNVRENLRLVTRQENRFNSFKMNSGSPTSKYKGVSFIPSIPKPKRVLWKPWVASLNVGTKRYAEFYPTETEAAIAYNKLALKHHGEFAKLNIIEDKGD